MKLLPTSLTRDYISNWTLEDAIRELVQNSKDTEQYDFDVSQDTLIIESFGGQIDIKNLLLGVGTKAKDKTKLGGFSEGLLLSLLILARENVDVEFLNGTETWEPLFDYNEDFNCETLFIKVEDSVEEHEGVRVTLNLDPKVIDEVVDRTLDLQPEYNKHTTSYGEILLDNQHSGKIYVGGLYISRFDSQYGFNFRPEDFPLDRDRKSLQPFDIKWRVKDMWAEVSEDADEETAEDIVDSIDRKDNSFEYVSVSNSENIVKAAEKLYNEKYQGKLVVSEYEEARDLEKAGNNNVEYVSNARLVNLIQKTESYKTVVLGRIDPETKSLEDLLADFEYKYYNEMSSGMFEDWEELRRKIEEQL